MPDAQRGTVSAGMDPQGFDAGLIRACMKHQASSIKHQASDIRHHEA
jgi:hypothetical protein